MLRCASALMHLCTAEEFKKWTQVCSSNCEVCSCKIAKVQKWKSEESAIDNCIKVQNCLELQSPFFVCMKSFKTIWNHLNRANHLHHHHHRSLNRQKQWKQSFLLLLSWSFYLFKTQDGTSIKVFKSYKWNQWKGDGRLKWRPKQKIGKK